MSDSALLAQTLEHTPRLRQRSDAVDLARGLIIVLMALDHIRDYLQAEQVDPTDLSRTTVPLFLTRWITHFCAPVFLFLAGVGVSLALANGTSKPAQARFLLLRGLWLIVLEVSVVHIGWSFNFQLNPVFALVIWAIGWSMISLAPLIFLPEWLVAAIGIGLIAGHNAFDFLSPDDFGAWSWLWNFLHVPGLISWGELKIFIGYPLIPWVGVMTAGVGFGRLLIRPLRERDQLIPCLGIAMILIFAVLRGGNLYGDPRPWTPQSTAVMTALSIINCQKYPPSLCYVLMTLGPILVAWPLFERWRAFPARLLITFGRVPLFFYLIHIFVIHAIAMGIVYCQLGHVPPWLWNFPRGQAADGCGVTLPMLYVLWIGVVTMLYPLCEKFGKLKAKSRFFLWRYL